MPTETPMIRQYNEVKSKYKDAILFYRMGDFYEMFFEDAQKASKILDLTLTSRNKNQDGAVPLCGFPVVSSQTYIQKLLSLGHKVAICEQVEDPAMAKGIVKREVVSVLTPGIVLDPECLEGGSHNYLVSVSEASGHFGIAAADISTGSFRLTEPVGEENFRDEILRLEPREILICELSLGKKWVAEVAKRLPQVRINPLGGWHFDPDYSREIFEETYKAGINALGLEAFPSAALAGGALLSYLKESKILENRLLNRPRLYHLHSSMVLDENTKRSLEITKTLSDVSHHGSLLWLIDRANTSMGSRCLKEWLLYPAIEIGEIGLRHDSVGEMVGSSSLLSAIQGALREIADIERIQNRVLADKAHARDLKGLKESFAKIPSLLESLQGVESDLLKNLKGQIDPLEDVCLRINETLVDDPPLETGEGGLIRQGVDSELDNLRNLERDGKSFISGMEAKEREATGISSLKIRYNNIFGYYIEVTHTHQQKVPSHYIRKQTLTNAERYITPELKEYEDKVLMAGERIKALEYRIFLSLRSFVASHSERIKKTAAATATVDALSSLAHVAISYRYVRPEMVEEPVLDIVQGRHPLVETLYREVSFVPNDLKLDTKDCRLIIITGPNMAGKSTIMRQSALIVIMAQMGGFVPAEKARVGIVDRIFTRIGASDYLQKGQSTFMVEMLETAQILAQATSKSLIILDEIGRGTSTFDGLSIAWAVSETIHDKIGARTLFATHYHELTDLAEEKPGIRNYHMAVSEWKGEVRFLHEIKKGGTNRSYGVHVAEMAGIPPETIARARQILKLLENKDLDFRSQTQADSSQPSLFEDRNQTIITELKDLPLDDMTPLEALNWLSVKKRELL